jgi:steroid delta-isomerase-like uncharacterized protein
MKRLFAAATVVAVSFALSAPDAKGEDLTATPIEVSQRLFEAFNRHDADTLAALYAHDAVLVSPDHPAPLRGPSAVRAVYAALFAQFPDIHDRIVSVTAQDERVAVEFVSTGCMADAAHCIELPIVSVLTIREGRIVRDVSYFDQ